MPIGGYRFRRSFGSVEGRRFRGARPDGFSPEAQNYFDRLDVAGDTDYIANKTAIAAYIDGLVALGGSYWDDAHTAALFEGVGFAGCSVPLKDTMPTITLNNFVSNDHSRTSGLTGDGATAYVDTGYDNILLPQTDHSASVYINTAEPSSAGFKYFIGGARTNISKDASDVIGTRSSSSTFNAVVGATRTDLGFYGLSRPDAEFTYNQRVDATTGSVGQGTSNQLTGNMRVFHIAGAGGATISASEIGMYFISHDLDNAVLRNLQDTLHAAIV